MSKRGFVRGTRKSAPMVPPVRVAVAPPLALPEREPRNILLMIALPALLVGIIGTLVVMYTSGSPVAAVGLFPDDGSRGLRCVDVQRTVRPRPADFMGRTREAAARLSAPARRGPRRSPARRSGSAP